MTSPTSREGALHWSECQITASFCPKTHRDTTDGAMRRARCLKADCGHSSTTAPPDGGCCNDRAAELSDVMKTTVQSPPIQRTAWSILPPATLLVQIQLKPIV